MEPLVFWLLAAATVAFTALTIVAKNPVYSAIFMILSFCSTAGIFVLLDAFLLAVVEVLVYAGAIMVLFLFVIMLINLRAAEFEGLRLTPLTVLAAGTLLALLSRAIADPGPAVGRGPNALTGSPKAVAEALFTDYVVPFEAISMLLLAAILGTVVLSRRHEDA